MKELTKHATTYVGHALEILAAIIIAMAVLRIFAHAHLIVARDPAASHGRLRVQFGTSVAVALELLLGADVLATAVAPSWNDIGQLAAIAIIRTALNYFLAKELKEYQPQISRMSASRGERSRRIRGIKNFF